MRWRLTLAAGVAALVLLTGAGQVSDGFVLTDATPDQVAEAYWAHKPGGPMHMGQWERSMDIAAFDMPGLPAGPEREAMQAKAKAAGKTESVCHSGDDLAAPEPRAMFEIFGENCHYDRLAMGGGRFDGKLLCDGEEGKVALGVSGTYEAERFAVRLDIDMRSADPADRITMTMNVAGHRTGECASPAKPE